MKNFDYYDNGVLITPLSIIKERVYSGNFFSETNFKSIKELNREKSRLDKIIKNTYEKI